MESENNPEDPAAGTRKIPFSKELYIEREDFDEDPPPKYYRLAPGREVRLKNAYIVKCTDFVRDEKSGEIEEIHCTYDPETKSGRPGAQRKVKSTLHWVSARFALKAEVRLYDYLLLDSIEDEEQSEEEGDRDFIRLLNPRSLEVLKDSLIEPGLKNMEAGEKIQFMRKGYFCVDPDSKPDKLVFNRIVSLRDSWEKIQKKN
jgi:glutaminyl-tRNA synthetase